MRLLRGRKGDLTLNTIVVAALVIIVLVVMVMIFTGRITFFNKGLVDTEASCAGHGGKKCSNGCPPADRVVDSAGAYIVVSGGTCCKLTYAGTCT